MPVLCNCSLLLLLQMVFSRLVDQDKLGIPETAAQDIASLAMTSRALSTMAKGTLWRLLGEKYPEEGTTTAKTLAANRWEARHISSNTRKLKDYTPAKTLARQYAEEVPDEVPAHIFGEVARLRCLGLAATNAKKEFQLTDKDLRGVERVDKSSADVAAIGCVSQYLRTPNAKNTPSQQQLVPFVHLADWAARNAGLPSLRKEVTQSEMRFLSFKIQFREEEDDYGYFGGGYYGKAMQAAAELDDWEEDDCIRLACQSWARRHGGFRAALTHPQAPPEGPLRDALAAVLRQGMASTVAYDAGLDDHQLPFEWDDDWEAGDDDSTADVYGAGTAAFFSDFSHFIQVELSARSGDALDVLQARVRPNLPRLAAYTGRPADSLRAEACLVAFEAPAGADGAGPAGGAADKTGAEAAQQEQGAAEQLEQGAAGEAAGPVPAVQQEQGAAGEAAGGEGMEEDEHAAGAGAPAAPAGAEEVEVEAGPGAHRCMFYVGVSEKEDPTSLLTGQACSQQPNRNVTLSNIRQTVFRWFEGGWKKDFAARQPGMAVRLRLLTADQVPTSVRAAASAET
ncbi:hypothetical protein COHA_008546 [Chlorella ohadii]|uniref:Uncharacterized protein n=1 Tax=Chlorella ohadii TaxID=2649997 RepID=A0AAD5H2E1_9CHLO|nr:hypothetical protein COHA_008546 [Chlorella ohadii]